jgi:hypothetical protein
LEGFKADNSLPQQGAWPQGPVQTTCDNLRWRSARFRYLEACAHHWWRYYLSAPDPEAAYAAWILFLRAADRRAWVWIERDADAAKANDEFYRLKMSHAQVNTNGLKRGMKKREDKLEEEFLNRAVQKDIGPWQKALVPGDV